MVVKIHRNSKGINCRIHYKESTVGTTAWTGEKNSGINAGKCPDRRTVMPSVHHRPRGLRPWTACVGLCL